ncbi:protein Tube [Phlebotomus argentipes]|uniref:protein Tube n=1 Tax=Phlebotomus argentipes TaxID=94469 RepID=UPI0028931B68|nr:protein Tube [Phlebotomus argentipes]
MTTLSRKTEIRHLPPAEIFKIAQQLDSSQNWKKLMRIIPKKLEEEVEIEEFGGKYNAEHIKIIENNKGSRLAAEILMDEWGTSGRIRPNLAHLLQLLVKAELFRAADYVADLLNEALPKRPEKGPAARIDISLPPDEEIAEIGGILSDMDYPNSSNINNIPSNLENNMDFYDKWTPNDQRKIHVLDSNNGTPENLIQFSMSSMSGTQDSNFSLHSDIMGNDGIILVGGEEGPSNASRNIPSSIDTLSTDIPDTVTSQSAESVTEAPYEMESAMIPDVSLLRVHRANPSQDSCDNIPHFSLLMSPAAPQMTEEMKSNISTDSESSQSRSEIISDNSIPNLPMLQGK